MTKALVRRNEQIAKLVGLASVPVSGSRLASPCIPERLTIKV